MNPAIFLSPWLWLAIASAAAAFCANGWRASHDAFVSFQAVQQALAGEQEKRTNARINADKINKEKTDNDHAKAAAVLAADNQRLRNARSRTSNLPASPDGAKRPDRITFDRAELDAAIGRLDAGVSRLVEQGDSDRLSLNQAKGWALRMSQEIRP